MALTCRRLKDVAEDALYRNNRNHCGSSAVHWAAKHGNTATLTKALKYGLTIHQATLLHGPMRYPIYGFSPLQTAVVHGQDSAVAWFLDNGADLAQKVSPRCLCAHSFSDTDIDGTTSILHTALCLRHVSTAQFLVSRGAPLEYDHRVPDPALFEGQLRNPEDNTTNALLDASLYGLDPIVKVLVLDHGMDLHQLDGHNSADALSCAALSNDNVSTIKTLLSLGANVDGLGTEWQSSPLHIALRKGNFSVAHALLDAGAKITPHEIDIEYAGEGEKVKSSTIMEVRPTPLHDTIRSMVCWRGGEQSNESWREERAAFMRRLIELGVDVNRSDRKLPRWQPSTPLDVATEYGDTRDMVVLLAAGAKVHSRMLNEAWETADDHAAGRLRKMKILLKHGARLDEPVRFQQTMLQVAAHFTYQHGESQPLHEVLTMSSHRNLSSDHLDEVLQSSLSGCEYIPSVVLVRHGANVSCKNKLFLIARGIVEDDMHYLDDYLAARECIGIVIDMGLSREDQCLIFHRVLRKRQSALAHLFLDRGLASSTEAATYLPACLTLAADWGSICVIKRLWQHWKPKTGTDTTLVSLLLQRSVVHGNREAASFFLDHGASPFDRLTHSQVLREAQLHEDALRADLAAMKAVRRAGVEGPPGAWDHLRLRREHEAALLLLARHSFDLEYIKTSPFQLAVRCGHADIVSDLLDDLKLADTDPVVKFGRLHIPCALANANEIQDLLVESGIGRLILYL